MGATVLIEYLRPLVTDLGLSSVLLFPSLGGEKQLSDGFDSKKNPLLRVASLIKDAFPKLCLIADVCLCTFTETGMPHLQKWFRSTICSLKDFLKDIAVYLMMPVEWTMKSQ